MWAGESFNKDDHAAPRKRTIVVNFVTHLHCQMLATFTGIEFLTGTRSLLPGSNFIRCQERSLIRLSRGLNLVQPAQFLIGILRNYKHDGDGNENVQKSMSSCITLFVHFFVVTALVKIPNSSRFIDINTGDDFLFVF